MHILVTNDDGVTALGLLALTQAMRAAGAEVSVLAPDPNGPARGTSKRSTIAQNGNSSRFAILSV